jgi:hypothetical protein
MSKAFDLFGKLWAPCLNSVLGGSNFDVEIELYFHNPAFSLITDLTKKQFKIETHVAELMVERIKPVKGALREWSSFTCLLPKVASYHIDPNTYNWNGTIYRGKLPYDVRICFVSEKSFEGKRR